MNTMGFTLDTNIVTALMKKNESVINKIKAAKNKYFHGAMKLITILIRDWAGHIETMDRRLDYQAPHYRQNLFLS